MALERGKLSNVVVVSAGSTVGIITVVSSKKVYVKSIIAHSPGIGAAATTTAQIYFIPNGESASTNTKIFDISLNSGETVLVEPSYPLVIDTTGDSIQVGAGSSTVNFLITGDKEV
jgi:hypothetical protein